ncbi:uncharacterized protein BKA78DRAFT_317587 [Phyllosticta capitalensis]|uniref:uncharacterized protein n=1 Tax=Phyllosticta capitalensis TaxID=121624 RepID=UPI00312EAD0F
MIGKPRVFPHAESPPSPLSTKQQHFAASIQTLTKLQNRPEVQKHNHAVQTTRAAKHSFHLPRQQRVQSSDQQQRGCGRGQASKTERTTFDNHLPRRLRTRSTLLEGAKTGHSETENRVPWLRVGHGKQRASAPFRLYALAIRGAFLQQGGTSASN